MYLFQRRPVPYAERFNTRLPRADEFAHIFHCMPHASVPSRLSLTLVESGRHVTMASLFGHGTSIVAQLALYCSVTVAFSQIPLTSIAPLSERPTFLAPLFQERPRPIQEALTYTAIGGSPSDEPAKDIGINNDGARRRDLVIAEEPGDGDGLDVSVATNEDLSRTFSEIEVDSAASRDPESAGPTYPPDLMAQGIEGSVLATFVVDTTGRPDLRTYIALESTNPRFSQAVRDALPHMKFKPAKRGAELVRQQVEQRFSFRVVKTTPPPPPPPSTKKPPLTLEIVILPVMLTYK